MRLDKNSTMEQHSDHHVDLSPFDQTIPRLFVHKLFCFPFPDAEQQPEAVETLEQALSATILKWPFITGTVGPADETGAKHEHNAVQLRYDTPTPGKVGHEVFSVRTLSEYEFPWSYQQLADANMPLSAMNKDVLSAVPEWPQPGETYPALAVQANFIEGGLILCFAFHHAVADGSSFCTFLKSFAAATRNPPKRDSIVEAAGLTRLSYTKSAGRPVALLESFPEYDPSGASVRPKKYHHITTRILTFKAATVQKLEEAIKRHLKETNGSQAWVSNIACLSSLIWVAVIRARAGRLDAAEITKIGIAVNARSVMSPPLPEDYFGNVIVHTNATAKVHELLPEVDVRTGERKAPISTPRLALAALRMREAVSGVTTEYVMNRLNTFSALSDPTETSRAYSHAMDTSNTGLDFSSWRDQGADVEFSIPGAGTSTAQFWRKAWSPNEGAYNILPRKGGSKGTADWEVCLGLTVEDMEKVCSDGELGGWFSKSVE